MGSMSSMISIYVDVFTGIEKHRLYIYQRLCFDTWIPFASQIGVNSILFPSKEEGKYIDLGEAGKFVSMLESAIDKLDRIKIMNPYEADDLKEFKFYLDYLLEMCKVHPKALVNAY